MPDPIPSDPLYLALVALGMLTLSAGSLSWLVGCLRVFVRGDRLVAVALAVGGAAVEAFALVGRPLVAAAYNPHWVSYTLPGVGPVMHRGVRWIGDDGPNLMAVGLGLLLGGLALTAMPRDARGGER